MSEQRDYMFADPCWPNQRAKSARVAVILSRSRPTCRFICNHSRNIGKYGKRIARLKWESENIMRGRLPTLKIASRQNGSSWLCDDDLQLIHTFTENLFWLATCVISDEIKCGYGCLSSPRCLHIPFLFFWNKHIPFLKPRRQLGNGNKPVSTVFWSRSIRRTILPAPPPVPRFPARHSPELQSSRRVLLLQAPSRAAAQPVCQFKQKIWRIDGSRGRS
jgi:hypothetical protein